MSEVWFYIIGGHNESIKIFKLRKKEISFYNRYWIRWNERQILIHLKMTIESLHVGLSILFYFYCCILYCLWCVYNLFIVKYYNIVDFMYVMLKLSHLFVPFLEALSPNMDFWNKMNWIELLEGLLISKRMYAVVQCREITISRNSVEVLG
jgi:hypothetical protein